MNSSPDPFLAFPAEFLTKSACVILLVFLLVSLARKASASQKHKWWVLGFVASLLLPLILLFPDWKVLPGREIESALSPSLDYIQISTSGQSASPKLPPADGLSPEKVSSLTIFQALAIVWLAGCALLLLQSIVSAILLRCLDGKSSPAPDRILERLHRLARNAPRLRATRLRLSDRVCSPFTWGIRNPRILLPDCASEWSGEDLDMVLAHEWEHVRRFDALSVLLSRWFIALNWVNPLAWIANHLATRSREDACDEAVIERGFSFDTYADLLYRQAAATSRSRLLSGAAAVVEKNTVSGRIRTILKNEGRRRASAPATIERAFTSAILLLAVAIGVVGFQEMKARDSNEPQVEISTQFVEIDKVTRTREILDEAILPKVEFDELPLKDAIAYLGKRLSESQQAASDERRIIQIRYVAPLNQPQNQQARITLRLSDVPLSEALNYTTSLGQMKYKITEEGDIEVVPLEPALELLTKAYTVGPEFLTFGGKAFPDAKELLLSEGINFGKDAAAGYDPATSRLVVRNRRDELRKVEQFLQENRLSHDPELEAMTLRKGSAQNIDPKIAALNEKLQKTIIPLVEFRDTPFRDALEFIQQKSVELDPTTDDPEKRGINLILDADGSNQYPGDIRITLRLSNVPLAEALRYTTALAQTETSVEPHAVVIRPIKKPQ